MCTALLFECPPPTPPLRALSHSEHLYFLIISTRLHNIFYFVFVSFVLMGVCCYSCTNKCVAPFQHVNLYLMDQNQNAIPWAMILHELKKVQLQELFTLMTHVPNRPKSRLRRPLFDLWSNTNPLYGIHTLNRLPTKLKRFRDGWPRSSPAIINLGLRVVWLTCWKIWAGIP